MMLGFLEGTDLLIVLGIVALLFGSSQLPKLARSLGSASKEFKKGSEEGEAKSAATAKAAAAALKDPVVVTTTEPVVEVVEVKHSESQAS